MRARSAMLSAAALLALAPSSRADVVETRRGVAGISAHGGFVLGLDHLFGYAVESVGGGQRSAEHFGVMPGLLAPRVSFHGVVRGGLTLGCSADIVISQRSERLREESFVVGPRIGFMFMSARGLGIWPRAGITAILPLAADRIPPRAALALELPVVIGLTEHAALTVIPTFSPALSDVPRYSMAGVTAGLLGAF